MQALRQGRAPDGSSYFPAFPYPSYTGITDRDLLDIKAYIFSTPPVARPNRAHDLSPPFGWRFLMAVWKALFFEPGPRAADPDRPDSWNRGRYLVEALGHCTECHTPRGAFGNPDGVKRFAGTRSGPEGGVVPNITPDPETGIGRWSDDDLDTLFTMGMLPDGDFVGEGMAEVTDNTAKLTPVDRRAMIEYLKSLPPVHNAISKKIAKPGGSQW